MKRLRSLVVTLFIVGLLAAPSFAPPFGYTGYISITKMAEDAAGVGFGFTGDIGDFELENGETHDWSHWLTGANDIEISEIVPTGWMLTDIFVTQSNDISGWSTVDLDNASVSFHFMGEITFDATFVNERIPPIPVPGAVALASAGLGCFGYLRRRKAI
ncbi:MAG: hypothetical protein ACYS8Z_15455 [Planctomycetota bacterium]|jgi:hypothetical protein